MKEEENEGAEEESKVLETATTISMKMSEGDEEGGHNMQEILYDTRNKLLNGIKNPLLKIKIEEEKVE